MKIIPIQELAPRCPDFDRDCDDVRDHLKCWKGTADLWYIDHYTEQAQGYCPYVIGQMKAHTIKGHDMKFLWFLIKQGSRKLLRGTGQLLFAMLLLAFSWLIFPLCWFVEWIDKEHDRFREEERRRADDQKELTSNR